MERRKQYNNENVQQDLYQYEMGIELGADVEQDKRNHQREYDIENSGKDFKNNVNNLNNNNQRNNQSNQRNNNNNNQNR